MEESAKQAYESFTFTSYDAYGILCASRIVSDDDDDDNNVGMFK